jgi:hypothetical protein
MPDAPLASVAVVLARFSTPVDRCRLSGRKLRDWLLRSLVLVSPAQGAPCDPLIRSLTPAGALPDLDESGEERDAGEDEQAAHHLLYRAEVEWSRQRAMLGLSP